MGQTGRTGQTGVCRNVSRMKKLVIVSFSFLMVIACKNDNVINRQLEALTRAENWLWAQQSNDGAWHSGTHNVLADGKVLTPYILFHLSKENRKDKSHHKQIEIAIQSISDQIEASITKDDLKLKDYPNYSAAYALMVLQKFETDTALQKIIADYLLQQQFIEHRGFTSDSLVYGGWGYGEPNLPVGKYGHVDVSHTRRVIQALKKGAYLDSARTVAALLFLKGAQRGSEDSRLYSGCIDRSKIPYDGGFVSSMVTLATNKCQPVGIKGAGLHYPSYATATCDGFLGLEALGLQNSGAYLDARQWLLDHHRMETIDGLSPDDPEQWADIMHYYHYAVRGEAMSIIEPEGSWRDHIMDILMKEQLEDGSFINPIGGVNKEDDPLMATIFAVQAMRKCLEK